MIKIVIEIPCMVCGGVGRDHHHRICWSCKGKGRITKSDNVLSMLFKKDEKQWEVIELPEGFTLKELEVKINK